MVEIKTDTPLRKTIAQVYGESIEALPADEVSSIIIASDKRINVLRYIKTKYGDRRQYTTQTDENSIIRLYRLK